MSAGHGWRRQGGRARLGDVTIKDVARACDVSASTVTRALQGSTAVAVGTRERVTRVAAELGYQPDTIARALVTGSTGTVGLLVSDVLDPWVAEITDGVEAAATRTGSSVLLAAAHRDAERERRIVDSFVSRRVDGLIRAGILPGVAPLRASGPRLPPLVQVALDRPVPADERDGYAAVAALHAGADATVGFDDVDAGRTVGEHLLALGHRRIAFATSHAGSSSLLRLSGLAQALAPAGLGPPALVAGGDGADAGDAAATRLLATAERPTAIVAADDLVALGVMRAARRMGLELPRDLSVVGFGDIVVSALVEPALTSLRLPLRDMGQRALSLLRELVQGEPAARHVVLQGVLVVRASAAPPAA